MAQYRVRFSAHFASYNGGEVGYFTSGTGQLLVNAGLGTALDAIPQSGIVLTIPPKKANESARAYVTRRYQPPPATVADSDNNAAESAVLAGF